MHLDIPGKMTLAGDDEGGAQGGRLIAIELASAVLCGSSPPEFTGVG